MNKLVHCKMINMYTKQEIIISSYREGKSQRTISRELSISRRTVKRYIEEFENYQRSNISEPEVLSIYLSQPIVYRGANRTKLKLTQEVQSAIDSLLEINEQKKHSGLRKQMMKKCDIYEQINNQGFDIGYTTVCNYIRSKSASTIPKEAFIRQVYEPGNECEFDWGEIKIYISGVLTRFQLAVFTTSYSNYRYADIYQRQDTLAFMESHVSFFDHIQGVFKNMVYDNMRVAVAKFVGKHEKEPTQALLQMRGHYQFSHRFCNAYRGNEKGHVERSVEYIRRKAFGIKDCFNTLEEAQQWLMSIVEKLNSTKQQLTGKTADQMFDEERKVLSPSSTKLACSEQIKLRVDKYSTISYRTNRYSVPDHLVGQFIDVRIQSHQIHIYQDNTLTASHERNYSKHQWLIRIEHYLSTFRQKPGALKGSVALASSTYLKQLYFDNFSDVPRDFIELLYYCYKHKVTNEKLKLAIKRLADTGIVKISTEQVKAILGNKQHSHKELVSSQTYDMAKTQLLEATALIN